MTEELRKYNDKTFRLYLQGDEFYLTEDDIALLRSLVFEGVLVRTFKYNTLRI